MRRRTRKSVVQLVCFAGILLLILFLNRPPTPGRTFAWTRITYQTTASTLPEARGICPGLATTDKPALVVSRVSDDEAAWLQALREQYHLCIYTADAPLDPQSTQLQVPANRGHEAMGYLTFLIDNYHELPAAGMVFVHGSRWAWHNDHRTYDNAALLAALNLTSALHPGGYHNLRCDWSVGTCPPTQPAQGSLELRLQSVLEPWSARMASDVALPHALAALFGRNTHPPPDPQGQSQVLLGRNDPLRAQCCAQFAVARANVWQHSQAEYIALRQWLLDGMEGAGSARALPAPADDRVAGRIMSYLWHILFIKQSAVRPEGELAPGLMDLDRLNQAACPSAQECYCRLYGKCGLTRCSVGSCMGEYVVPKDFKVPESVMER
ncbi:DUF3431 domain-containing protein [Aspergillus saccharolyticus JOP 1030-1]|uniref:Uncharacterized protein n=1 Tax=Aspergillus saccharolyticus JOP 1030-1 TaxID=1450539 RepID=A0A318ZKS5_9EURO|nr:hypothetical protein BP01DRAFT_307281 [Aspergillus saccharolyticus JOP 1030-1]PYH40838.1 hypothetical protein BP01DRAFT_307281 [Aspergillus saccharolyticus JOP 1030-1]